MTEPPTIGLALSGGGSRAIAFHLGCLRALHDLGILSCVKVLSTVSGGSVIGALYATTDAPFPEFEARVRAVLARGLMVPALKAAFCSLEGPKAFACALLTGSINILFFVLSWTLWTIGLLAPSCYRKAFRIDHWHPPVRRFASRTTILRRAMDDQLFSGRRLDALEPSKPFLIINAAELRTGSAFYFTARESGSWRLGCLAQADIRVSHAVTASAAYPMFLPALDQVLPFNKRDGSRRMERVSLSDGGVYDNLGLAPLWPDRDPSVSLNVQPVNTIICCRAGYGLRHDPPPQFMIARIKSSFASIFDRAQNAATKRLFELRAHGRLGSVVMPYLGQDDARLKFRPGGLVTREDVYAYPTDFSAMNHKWVERLSRRGEQLTRALIAEHAPHLIEPSGCDSRLSQ
jgi:NTE family protein